MTRDEYEAHRRRLADELRAAIELAEEGYRARVRALDLAWQAAAPGVPLPADSPEPIAKRRRLPGELTAEIRGLLPRLPQVFSKEDLLPLFAEPPQRASLFRALQELIWDGSLRQEQRGHGRIPTTYRQRPRTQGT